MSAKKLATRWRVTTATSSATQAAAQAAAKVARGWPTPTPARLPKSVAAHAADLEISADLGRDDASIDMVAPSPPTLLLTPTLLLALALTLILALS